MNKNEENVEKLEMEMPAPKSADYEIPKSKPIEPPKMKEPAQGNIIGMVIFFVLLMGFVIALPYINDLESLFNNKETTNNNEPNNTPKSDEKEKEEDQYYPLNTDQITYDEIVFSNFELRQNEDYTIYFNVTTTKSNGKSLASTNYFLELYTSNQTLIERVKIEKNISISKNGLSELEFEISENSYNNTANIRIISMDISDFPEVTLSKNANDTNILTCINNTNTIIYSFDENKKSTEIEDVNTYEKKEDTDDYFTLLANKRSEVASLNNQDGISSSLSESSTGFVTNTLIVLSDANITNLKNFYYYPKDTLAKVIAFEMSARSFVCN